MNNVEGGLGEGWRKLEKHSSWRQTSDVEQGLELGHRGHRLAEVSEPGERYKQFEA